MVYLWSTLGRRQIHLCVLATAAYRRRAPLPAVPVVCVVIPMSSPRRFVCDFVDEVPDTIFDGLTHAGQAAFESVNPATGLSRLRAQYYVMAMHNMSLADALTMFKVGVCVCMGTLHAVRRRREGGDVLSIIELASWVA